jgi:fatty acid/phospholipid biosynthesis enzyme
MICHGRSSSKAIKNAILQAHALANGGLIEAIRDDIAQGVL